MGHDLLSWHSLDGEDRPVGVLVFNTKEARAYTDEEIAYLSCFADHAALAIVRARLHEKAKAHAAELEARVKERTVEMEEALRAKEEFLSRMSHEFRTPLNFVLGFADLLVRETAGPLTPTQARYLNRIQMGGQHLLDLVKNLLDLTSPAIRAELAAASAVSPAGYPPRHPRSAATPDCRQAAQGA